MVLLVPSTWCCELQRGVVDGAGLQMHGPPAPAPRGATPGRRRHLKGGPSSKAWFPCCAGVDGGMALGSMHVPSTSNVRNQQISGQLTVPVVTDPANIIK